MGRRAADRVMIEQTHASADMLKGFEVGQVDGQY